MYRLGCVAVGYGGSDHGVLGQCGELEHHGGPKQHGELENHGELEHFVQERNGEPQQHDELEHGEEQHHGRGRGQRSLAFGSSIGIVVSLTRVSDIRDIAGVLIVHVVGHRLRERS